MRRQSPSMTTCEPTLPGSLTCKNVTVIDFQRSMLLRREPAGPPRRWVDGGFRHGPGRTETAGPRRMQVRRGLPAVRVTLASCASAVWRVGGEQVVGIAGIRKIGTAGDQQSFHLLGCFLDHTARLAGLKLAPQLDERLV